MTTTDLARRERGFVMVALLIGMAVTAIYLASLLPAWRQQAVREQEENLVFYGNQYARAIALFYLKNNCTLPGDVDVLISGHYLRRKWLDPITGKDFLPQMTGGANGSSSAGQSGANGARGAGPAQQLQVPTGGNRGGAPAAPAGGAAPGRGGTPTGGGTPSFSGQAALVGLAGVSSTSNATSIRVLNNQQEYDLWPFNYQAGLTAMHRSPACQNGQPVGPGAAGGNGNRQGDGRNGGAAGGPGGGFPGRNGGGNGQAGGPGRTGGGQAGPPPAGVGRGRGGL